MSMGPMGGSRLTAWRSYSRDRGVLNETLPRDLWRRVLRYGRPFRPLVVLFLITLVIGSLLTVAQPLLFRRIVDDGITPGNASIVSFTAIAVGVVAIIDAGIGLYGRYLSARIGEGLIFNLRAEVFDHVQRQSLAFFTRAQTGALVSRLNSDVIGAQQAFTSTLSGVVGNLISVVVVLVSMLILSWQITVLALVLVPLFLLPARWLGRRLQVLTREQMQLNADLSAQMTERFNVAGALLVKLYGRPQEEDELYQGKAAGVRDLGVRIAMANRYFFTALTLVAALATAIAYGVGGNLVIGETITLGTLLAIVALLAQLYGPLTALSNVRVDVMTALVSFDRVFEVLDLKPLVADEPDARPLPAGIEARLEFRDVGFTYPRASEVSLASLEGVARSTKEASATAPALHEIDFTVAPGTMTALVGPSGAGKTTITALVSRLYDPDAGAVTIGGHDLREMTQQSVHDAVGVVTQDAHLFHDTILANLRYANPSANIDEVWAACEDARIAELIRSLPDGMDTMVGDRGHRLSGGEKQRLAIARLLLKQPQLVVLDEATAHLDSDSEAAVQRALARALSGRTSLVIAHRLSTIREADEILVVDSGRIVERGSHADLLAAGGLYAELYRTQFSQPD